jgi:L-2-hydroxyglutarate oxidase
MAPKTFDIAVIGGGIVGCAAGMALSKYARLSVLLLEAEDRLAAHQTGNNSGVIHSGLYYKPGSLKARNCVSGREAMYAFCEEHGIPSERCGKVVVATNEVEIPRLDELERRGRANGLRGLRRLKPEEIRDYEPHASGIDGLLVPDTGIVDYEKVTEKFAEIVMDNGGEVRLNARLLKCRRESGGLVLETAAGEFWCRCLVNCTGLLSDRAARLCGVEPGLKIIPFRGEYYTLKPDRGHLVRNLIYPVPDPAFPFLGVHFTRMIGGGVEAGPNAVLAFKREGYKKSDFSLRDVWETFTYRGFLILISRFMKMGLGEMYRSYVKSAFVKALQRLIPEIEGRDISPGGAGVRAQALEPEGTLVDDFRIVEAERMVHVLNAPSPAATAAISIGEYIAAVARRKLQL